VEERELVIAPVVVHVPAAGVEQFRAVGDDAGILSASDQHFSVRQSRRGVSGASGVQAVGDRPCRVGDFRR